MIEPQPSRFASLRNAFISGLILLAPLAVTWIVFAAFFEKIGGGFRPYFLPFIPQSLSRYEIVWNIIATLIVVVLITALGYVSRYVLGKYFGSLAERFIQRIPGVSNVYRTVKQIVGTFGTQKRNLFSKVVLIEFPRKGAYTVGFLTGPVRGEIQTKVVGEFANVFIPTTPNPTSGFLILVPKSEIIELQMSVGDGMKMIISGGAVVPPWPVEKSRDTA